MFPVCRKVQAAPGRLGWTSPTPEVYIYLVELGVREGTPTSIHYTLNAPACMLLAPTPLCRRMHQGSHCQLTVGGAWRAPRPCHGESATCHLPRSSDRCSARFQGLLQLEWPPELLLEEDARTVLAAPDLEASDGDYAEEGGVLFSGLRVRMGVSTGCDATISLHQVTGACKWESALVQMSRSD
jgi:hypothetical protein